ncbi:MAG: ABC transporter permease [Anaerolineae bacterium]|nr:ABC transporter permease [Anaerolineae bacterium]
MFRRIWAVIQKEFIQTLRDRSTLTLLLTMPVLQLFLYGFAINMNVDHIATVVADHSLDASSRAYVAALESSTYFDVIGYVQSEAEVTQMIDAGRARVGIVIPDAFDTQVARGDAHVLFLIDGSDYFTMQAAYSAGNVIAQAHASELVFAKVARSGLAIRGEPPLDTRMRILYNPDMDQLWFVIPGLAAMLLQTQSIALTAAAVVREFEVGTMEQLLVTPIRPGELLLGKIVPNIVIAMINMLTVLGLGHFVFGVPFRGSPRLFMALSFVYVFAGLGLGLLISTIAKNLKQVSQMILMVMMLGVVLGGFMFPRYSMPPVLRWVGNLFPMTYFIPISRGIVTKGVGLELLWDNVLPLAIYAIVIMVISSRLFRQGLE